MNWVRCLYVIVYLTVCKPRHVSSQRPVQVNNVGIPPNIQKVPVSSPNQYPNNIQHVHNVQPPNIPINVQHIQVPNQHPINLQNVPNQYPTNVQNHLANTQQVQQQQPLPHQHLVHQQKGTGIIGSLLQIPKKVIGHMASRIQKRNAVIPSDEWGYVSEAVNLARNKLFDSTSNPYGYTQDRHYYVVVIDVILRLSSEVYWQTQKNYDSQNEIYHKIYEETARNVVMDSMVYDTYDKNSRMQYYYQNYVQLIKMLTDFKGYNPGMVSQYITNLKSQLSTVSMLFLEMSSKLDQVISQNVPLSYILENPDILQDITMAIVDLSKDFNSFYMRNSYLNLSYEEHLIVQLLVKISTAIFKPQMVSAYNRMLSLVDNSKMVDHLYYHSLKHKKSEGYVTDDEQNVYSNNKNKYLGSGTIIVYVLDKSKANQFNNLANSGNKQINEKLLKQYLSNPNYKRVILIKDKTEANVITSPNKEWLDVIQGKKVLIDDVYSINCDVKTIDTTTQSYNDDIDIKICAHFKKSNLEDSVSITDIQPNISCNQTWPYRKDPWNVRINTESPQITFDDIRTSKLPGSDIPSRTTSCQQIWIDGVYTQSCEPQESTTLSYWQSDSFADYTPTEYPRSIGWSSIHPRPKSPWNRRIISPKSSCQPILVDGVSSYDHCQSQDDYTPTEYPWSIGWSSIYPRPKSPWNRRITSPKSSCQPILVDGVSSYDHCRSQDDYTPTEYPWSIGWNSIHPRPKSPWNRRIISPKSSCQPILVDGVSSYDHCQSQDDYTPTEYPWSIGWSSIHPRPKSPWNRRIISPKSSCQPILVDGVSSYDHCQSQDDYTPTEYPWSIGWSSIHPRPKSPWNRRIISPKSSCQPILVDGVSSYDHCQSQDDYTPTEYPWSIGWSSIDPRPKSPWNRRIISPKSSCQPILVDGVSSYDHCQSQDDYTPTEYPWSIGWSSIHPRPKSPWNRRIISPKSSCQPILVDGVSSYEHCQSQEGTTISYWNTKSMDEYTPTEYPWSVRWSSIHPRPKSPWNRRISPKSSCQPIWLDGVLSYEHCQSQEGTTRTIWDKKESDDLITTDSPWPIEWTQIFSPTRSPWNEISASRTIPSCQPKWIGGVIIDQPCISQDSSTPLYDYPSTESSWSIKWDQTDPKPTTESDWDNIYTTQTPWSIQWISQDPVKDITWEYSNPTSQPNTESMDVITSTQSPWPWKYISRIPNDPQPIQWVNTERTRETRWKDPYLPFWSIDRINTEPPKINWYTNDPTMNTEWKIKWQYVNPKTEVYWDYSSTISPFSIKTLDDPSWQLEPNNTQLWTYKWDMKDQAKPTWKKTQWWTADPVTSTPPSIEWKYNTPQTYYPWKIKWTQPKLSTRDPKSWSVKWIDYKPISKATLPPPQPIKWISYRPITETSLPTAKTIIWEDYDPTWKQNYDPNSWNYEWFDAKPTTKPQNIEWINLETKTQSPIPTSWKYVTSKVSPWSIEWIYQNPTTESWQPKWTYQETATPRQFIWSTRKPSLSPWSINWGDYDVSTETEWKDIYPTTRNYLDRKVVTKLPWDIFWTQDLPKQTSSQPIKWESNGFGNMWIGEINGIPNDFDLSSNSINELLKLNCHNYNDYISPISENYNFNSNRKEISAYILTYKERVYFILRNRNNYQYQTINNNGCQIKDITCDVEIPPCIKLNKLYLKNVTMESNAANYFGPLISEINADALLNGNGCQRESDYPDWVEQHVKPILENNDHVKQILYPNAASNKPVIGWTYVPNMKDDHPFALDSCYSSHCLKNFMYCANGTCFWNSIKCYRGNCDYGIVRCLGAKCYKSKKKCNVNDCINHFNKNIGSCCDDKPSIPTQDEIMMPYSRRKRSKNSKHCVGQFCFSKNNKKPYIFQRK